MPTHEDFDRDYLDGPARDPRTGAPAGTGSPPLTDADRELCKLLDRERWIGAISVPPPAPRKD